MSKSLAVISYHTCPLALQEGKQTGGMNIYVLELSKALSKLDLKLDIYTRAQGSKDPLIVNLNPHLRLIHLPTGVKKPLPKAALLKLTPQYSKNLINFIKKNQLHYHIIHSHYYLSGLIGTKLKTLLPNSKHLITFHTLALMKNLVARHHHEQPLPERIKAELDLIKKVDQIIVPSENEKNYLQHLYQADPKKLSIIPPGIDLDLFKPMSKLKAKKIINADPDHKIVLFVGRLEPLKGIDTLIYAIKILTSKHPDSKICLWIVGNDISKTSSEQKKLEHLKNLLHLPGSVKFINQKSQKDLPHYYNASEVVVMPSHYESFGMVALEALACNTPVITTEASGISSLIIKTKNSTLSSPNHPLALANKIEHLIKNPFKLPKAFSKSRSNLKHLTWDNIAQKINTLYHEL